MNPVVSIVLPVTDFHAKAESGVLVADLFVCNALAAAFVAECIGDTVHSLRHVPRCHTVQQQQRQQQQQQNQCQRKCSR